MTDQTELETTDPHEPGQAHGCPEECPAHNPDGPDVPLVEPDNPAAYALARHIADHPMSTIYAAFRYLNAPLTVEFHEDPDTPTVEPTPAPADLRQRIAEAIADFPVACWTPDNIAGRVMRVRDRYLEQLAAGRETWKRKAEEIEADRDRLQRAIDAARALHQPMQRGPFTICAQCSGWDGEWRCRGLITEYPCPTIVALQPPAPAHDAGPSVAEAKADDRKWPLEKAGE